LARERKTTQTKLFEDMLKLAKTKVRVRVPANVVPASGDGVVEAPVPTDDEIRVADIITDDGVIIAEIIN